VLSAGEAEGRKAAISCGSVAAISLRRYGSHRSPDALRLAGLGLLATLVGCFGLADAFSVPATTAYLPSIVHVQAVLSANALLSMTRMLGHRAVGTLLGGVIVAAGGGATCFLLDAATFVFSALLVQGPPRAHVNQPEPRALRREAIASLTYARSQRWLAVTVSRPTALYHYRDRRQWTVPPRKR
jgi:hypothetical protein